MLPFKVTSRRSAGYVVVLFISFVVVVVVVVCLCCCYDCVDWKITLRTESHSVLFFPSIAYSTPHVQTFCVVLETAVFC